MLKTRKNVFINGLILLIFFIGFCFFFRQKWTPIPFSQQTSEIPETNEYRCTGVTGQEMKVEGKRGVISRLVPLDQMKIAIAKSEEEYMVTGNLYHAAAGQTWQVLEDSDTVLKLLYTENQQFVSPIISLILNRKTGIAIYSISSRHLSGEENMSHFSAVLNCN